MGLLARLGLPPPPRRAGPGDAPPAQAQKSGRRPAPPAKPPRERNDAELRELAMWPGNAHRIWKRLSGSERMALTVHMANRYGQPFAKQFLGFTKGGAKDEWATFGGPFPEYKPEWFRSRGYVLIQKDSANQWWGHANGHVMVGQFGAEGAKRAGEIADQKAFDAAFARLKEEARKVLSKERSVLGMQNIMELGSASDDDRPGEYDEYVKRLGELERLAEATLGQAQALRAKYAPKQVDVSALNPVIAELTRQRDQAVFWQRPEQLQRWEPRDAPVDLPPAGDEPIDFSGSGKP